MRRVSARARDVSVPRPDAPSVIELDDITQASNDFDTKVELTATFRADLATRLAAASTAPAVLLYVPPRPARRPTVVLTATATDSDSPQGLQLSHASCRSQTPSTPAD